MTGQIPEVGSQFSIGIYMFKPSMFNLVLVAGLVSVLASSRADTSSIAPAPEPCNAEAAQSLVGKPKPTNARAMQLTNAKTVRQIEPGQMVTQDFQEDRVTIETGTVSGLVIAARCG
jgi:hypothetical protein